jgi:imidazolonepropionase-like amidohydrolase
MVMEDHKRNIGIAIKSGVRVAMGTDSGVGHHGSNAEELALMVEAGMTPMQAIVASTRMGAQLLQLGDKVGTLEAGKLADVVVLDGNPAERIDLLSDPARIRLVMKDGVVVRADAAMQAVAAPNTTL